MKIPVCERGKKCIFLKKEIENYIYESKGRITHGKQLNYICSNPKKVGESVYRFLEHEDKFKMCKYKVTDTLEGFINVES